AAKKSLGQNFLIDKNLVNKLVDASGVGTGDLVLEVGPGTGTLTGVLLEHGCDVVASELDDGLARLVSERFSDRSRLTLIHGDCLSSKRVLSPEIAGALGDRPFRLVANLPYQAATPLMLVLLTGHPNCRGMAVTIQKEVADRLMAGPGSKVYGTISVIAQCTARVRRVANLPNECFWPRPKVTSSMVTLERLDEPLTDDAARLGAFCQRVFAGRRKQLAGLLRSHGLTPDPWPENIAPSARIESLAPGVIETLAKRCLGV
ncbi:MAG: 16S rRNA (adenine(1518)-N(6)/adenine(1519)-N(6))-dimethyltransferase RsmA, partial [Phycisphaerales bacterium]|nr:16S rRNA (adenine(1518)-N(6)/adenine(1519)-N(6))-dimethyltransferase RsmA [Phycisphaerales bacterium]